NTVALVAGLPGAGQRILLSHPQLTGTGQFVQELQVSTVDDPGPGAGEPVEPRVVLDRVADSMTLAISPDACRIGWGFLVDASGRLYLPRVNVTQDPANAGTIEVHSEVVRVDPATGAQQTFGAVMGID